MILKIIGPQGLICPSPGALYGGHSRINDNGSISRKVKLSSALYDMLHVDTYMLCIRVENVVLLSCLDLTLC